MNVLQAVILGIVQGFAEYLPISSSGHLVLLQKLFGLEGPMMTFDIVLHLGSLVAVLVVFWSDVWALIKNPFQKMTFLLIIGTIPAVLAGLLFKDQLEALFEGGLLLAVGFVITGLFLLYADRVRDGYKRDKDITIVDAVIIGCMQVVGIPPGISRSGSTITGALARKLNRETAAKYSFLLSIPVILGAAVITGKDVLVAHAAVTSADVVPLLFGFVAAMLSGYVSIRFMLALVKKCKLRYFSYYVFALAAFILVDHFLL